jgi:arsenate reductase-like glutaredoxin family protein
MVKIFGCDDSPKVGAEIAEANANLIAEAFNVYTETGMTPRELKELARTWENEAERRSRRYEADVSALRNELDATKAQGGGK